MAYVRTIDNKEFTYHYEIRAAYSDINFPSVITDEMLSQIGIQIKEIEQEDLIEATIESEDI